MAVSLSAEMLRNGETKSNVAIIGRMASKSFAGTLSQMLIGNSALCIDWLVSLDAVKITIMVVCSRNMASLTKF